ncbi:MULTISPECIES: APC family permease [unclassified Bartonella]|uniref:APC family permease n=1 Tax=unclassified Bartonella TaxID=2645622 RepID=UPI0015FB1E50|nr:MULTISPECIES: amino acid permease [unclassified Bartonella]UXN04534.1 amino acid permease [Bartonella sp. HY406]UXN07577.1 amino acid permease [Bartonella sp. HY761]
MSSIFRKKTFTNNITKTMARTLGWPHLVALGVGATVGTGIYTLIGVGADRAGPAVLISFLIAGLVSACAAFAYAELTTAIPHSGGAYTFSYVALGEFLAWIVGWALILEYSLVVSTVAVSWSGYAVGFLHGIGINLPIWLSVGYHTVIDGQRGLINLPAILIIFGVTAILIMGTRESAFVNAILVVIKILALVLFVAIALPYFNSDNLTPFMPYGFQKNLIEQNGILVEHGVMAAASIVFFAFYGFDAIANAAEETKNPARDLSIGIIGSLIICLTVYILVALAAIGASHFTVFAASPEPLAFILRSLGQGKVAGIIGAIAIIALPTVILAFFYGQTRIFFVMGRDGLLPQVLSKLSKKTQTPVVTSIFTAIVVSICAGIFRLDEIAALANAGTLIAFTATGISLLMLRIKAPELPRKFKVPLVWVSGPIIVLGCSYLFWNLPNTTKYYCLIWTAIGIVFYASFGYWNSRLRSKNNDEA